MAVKKHAILPPSAATRWLNCPGSAKLEEMVKGSKTKEANEGTNAHKLAADSLLNYLKSGLLEIKTNDQVMKEYITDFCNYVIATYKGLCETCEAVSIFIEDKLDISKYVPECYGTADVMIIADKKLVIIDLKYGAGIYVTAYENPQLLLYGLGGYEKYYPIYEFEVVEMIIYQPRLNNITIYERTISELFDFAYSIREKAEHAYSGNGDCIPGTHCQFCKVIGKCRSSSKTMQEIKPIVLRDYKLMSEAELGQIYKYFSTISTWIDKTKEFMISQATLGVNYPGLKLVVSRYTRDYADTELIEEALVEKGINANDLYEKKFIGITALEKLLGKKETKILEEAELIIKKSGKLTLAEDNDKRQEYKPENEILNEFLEEVS